MKYLKEFGLTNEQINQFQKYSELLLEWNEKFNLTAITNPEEIEIKHFIDSIYPTKFINLSNKSLLDVGSGAGFPGIPLAICNKDLRVTLVESSNKKCTFLREVIKQLDLQNVDVICGRSEELNDKQEAYDYVTARAVKQLNILLEICSHLLKICGDFIAYKGSDAQSEIAESKRAISKLELSVENVYSYALPGNGDPRNVVVLKKNKKTPKKYPRKYSEIVKSPL